ncbi:MAG TPA: Rrf2 family transcriptional regulator [Candidatus Limnocylindrales bacterium]|nr:Rrf2 family transcriptional regulator [Candidatus Limnocylindrales bacterium]
MRIELTRRGDYAVRAALAIALLEDGRPVSARRIAERMDIPGRFLAHVLTDLVRAGIVAGTTGRNGGYRLAAPPAAIDLLRVVDAVEDRGDPPRCVLRGGPCRLDGTCAVHDAFFAATSAMRRELAAVSLADLVADGLATRRPEPAPPD